MRSRNDLTGADGSATRRRARRVIAELSGVLLAASVATAQPVEPAASEGARPRIGLVLSGGGARGAAHVGVLEVLEELRVPVDVISGTSMGSLVGGLYAAGLSPEELSRVIQGVDWVRFFNDKPDRQKLSYRRKEDDLNFLTDFRLAFKDGSFFVPPGLIEGQKLDFLLRTLTLGPDGVAHFEDLRLPFRAVATDINTGEAVILETGTLATAQRASMSIPAAFSPVELDGRLLVDGYVANNLPIDAAQGLGAERVIAVDISTPLSEIDSRSSAFAINAHASGFSTKANQDHQKERLAPDDILITPDLGGLGATSFSRMEEAIAAGRRAAEAASQVLSRYSVSEEEYAAWRAHHRRQPPQLPIVDEIRIENDSLLADAVIRARVRTRTGEPLDLEVLQEDLGRLFGLDTFERVQFDLRRESGRMVLVYHVEERLRGKYFLRFGLRLATDFGNDAGYQFGVNHVVLPLNAWGGELRSYVQVGESYVVSSEYYQPVDSRDWFFVQPEAAYNLEKFDVFQNDDRLARYDLERVMVAFNLGANIGQFARIQAGIGYLDGQAELDTGDPQIFGDDNFSGGIYQTTLSYDTLDNTSFPNDGAIAQVQGLFMREELGFSESFETLRVDGSIFRTFRRNTVGLSLRYRTNFGAPNSTQFLYSLGGLNRLSGFEHNSISGPHTGLVRLSAYRRLASPAIFAWEFPLYVGAQFELGNAWQERDEIDDLLYSLGPMLGFDTPLGPLYLAYAYGEGGEHQGYLTLGWNF